MRRAPSTTLAPCTKSAARTRDDDNFSFDVIADKISFTLSSLGCIAHVALLSELWNATRENIFCRLATGHLLQVFGIPSPLHRDLGRGVIDVMQIVGCEFD